jgi:hypothetical protein
MSPGVMSSFSSTSSRPMTSTRIGSSSIRRSRRVDATMISSPSCTSGSSSTTTKVSAPARMRTLTLAARKPAAVTRTV